MIYYLSNKVLSESREAGFVLGRIGRVVPGSGGGRVAKRIQAGEDVGHIWKAQSALVIALYI